MICRLHHEGLLLILHAHIMHSLLCHRDEINAYILTLHRLYIYMGAQMSPNVIGNV